MKGALDSHFARGHSLDDFFSFASPDLRPPFSEPIDDGRPNIDLTGQDLPLIRSQAWDALKQRNSPPVYFRRAGVPVRLERDERGNPHLRDFTPERLRHELSNAATYSQRGQRTVPPQYLATPEPPLPPISRIVQTPHFAPDGSLRLTAGYWDKTATYLDLKTGFQIPAIPESPSRKEVEAAVGLLNEWLSDFPFASMADRAHVLGLLLLLPARDLIDGPTPGHSLESPTPGTGLSDSRRCGARCWHPEFRPR
jgi:hypothetical protein